MSIRENIITHLRGRMLYKIIDTINILLMGKIFMDWTLGQYNQFVMQSALFILVFSFGIFSSVQYFIGKQLLHPKLASRRSLYFLLIALGILALAQHYDWIHLGLNYTSTHFPYLILAFGIFGIWQEFNYAICISIRRIRAVNTWVLIGPLALTLLYVLHLLGYVQLDLSKLVLVATINQLFAGVVSSIIIAGDQGIYPKGRFPLREFLSYGGLVYVNNILQFLVYRFDYWVLEKEDLTHFAFYTLASQMISLMWFFPRRISDIFFVYTVDEPKKMVGVTARSMIYTFLIQLSVGIAIIVGLLVFFWLMKMHTFYNSIEYFLALLPASILFGLSFAFSVFQAANRRLWVLFGISLTTCLMAIVLSLYLIPRYGVWGTIWESSIVYGFTFFIHSFYFVKYCKISYKSLLSGIKQEGKKILHEKNFSISEYVFHRGKKK